MSVLELKDVTVRFGGLLAVDRVNIKVEQGEIFSVIGPNGAGKTTLFNVISGVYEPTGGEIRVGGKIPVRSFSFQSFFDRSFDALLAGCVFGMGWNIQTLWTRTITDNYRYLEPFDWVPSLRDGMYAWWMELPLTSTWLPVLAAFATVLLGSIAIWRGKRRTPEVVSGFGIARTFQNIRLFPHMTVLENVLVGMHSQLNSNFWDALLRLPRHFTEQRRAEAKAREVLEFVGLAAESEREAYGLPYGRQRRLEIARALASSPSLLLLDEPAAGTNPTEAQELMELIRRIRDSGVTVVLIEHHMPVVMNVSSRIAVLDYGKKIAEGSPQEIASDPRVIEAYLGSTPPTPSDDA